MVQVELSEDEARYLQDILGWWIEGHEPATSDVIRDRTFDSPEEMLTAIDGMHKQFAAAVYMQERIKQAAEGRVDGDADACAV